MEVWQGSVVRIACSYINLNIFLISDRSLPAITMNPLEPPTKEELAQELLDFKHLAFFPDIIYDITFKVQLLSMKTDFLRQIYLNYRDRKIINHKKYVKTLDILIHQLKLPIPIDSQRWRYNIIQTRAIRKDRLLEELNLKKEIIASDRSQEDKIASKMKNTEQDILACVECELETFKRIKEKQGQAFKYVDITEEELRKIAEKRFGKALETIQVVQSQNQTKKI